jgi:RNA polymerase sigma factor (sigma-70 family)
MKGSNVNDSRGPHDGLSGTSTSLLRKAVAADQAAWNELVDKYAGTIYSWCLKYGVSPNDARDVVQEVLSAVMANLEQYRHDRDTDTFRGWLRQITARKVLDEERRRKRRVGVAEGGSEALVRLYRLPSPREDEANGTSTAHELAARYELKLASVYVIRSRVLRQLRANRQATNHEDARGSASAPMPPEP